MTLVTVEVPAALAGADARGRIEVVVAEPAGQATVGDVLAALAVVHPRIERRLRDETGQVRRFVNLYLNGDDIRFLQQLETKVKDGDEISIVPAIAGGRR